MDSLHSVLSEKDPGVFIALDIGGSLCKVCFLELPNSTVSRLLSTTTYGETGVREEEKSFAVKGIGRFHFVRFETRQMETLAIPLIQAEQLHSQMKTLVATGGGSVRFAPLFKEKLGIELEKKDELETCLCGLLFTLSHAVDECYTFVHTHFRDSGMKQVARRIESPFPCLVVNCGSGVSVVLAKSPERFQRVNGTALGGGTFYGLCRLLTRCKSFQEAMEMSARGDCTRVNLLVRDIFGGDYEKMGLTGSMTASFFAKAQFGELEGATEEDIAQALVVMISQNITQISLLAAQLHNVNRIFFTGSFVRASNSIAQRTLCFSLDTWSGGTMEALFVKHEGVFGSLGALLQSLQQLEEFDSHPLLRPHLVPVLRTDDSPTVTPMRASRAATIHEIPSSM